MQDQTQNQMAQPSLQSRIFNKLNDKGAFTEQDMADVATQSAQGAVQAAAPAIGQQAIQATLSPENISKKKAQFKQGLLNSIMNPMGGAQ